MTQAELLTADQVQALKEKHYKRNFIAFMLEAFFFSMAGTTFSYFSVLPSYVSNVTSNPFFLSLILIIAMIGMSGMQIFSCVLSTNARMQKRLYLLFSYMQRVAMFTIYLSSLSQKSTALTLIVFFTAFSFNSIMNGLSMTAFSNMVSKTIYRNQGRFFGTYSMANSLFGIAAARFMAYIFSKMAYPYSYQLLFLVGAISGLCATTALAIMIKEIPIQGEIKNIKVQELPGIIAGILKENVPYRSYLPARMCAEIGLASFTYYIVYFTARPSISAAFIGNATMVVMIASAVGSMIWGHVADRFGPLSVITFATAVAIGAPLVTFLSGGTWLAVLCVALLGMAQSGVYLSGSVATVQFSKPHQTAIFAATTGLMGLPVSLVTSALYGFLSKNYGTQAVFAVAAGGFVLTTIIAMSGWRKTAAHNAAAKAQ